MWWNVEQGGGGLEVRSYGLGHSFQRGEKIGDVRATERQTLKPVHTLISRSSVEGYLFTDTF